MAQVCHITMTTRQRLEALVESNDTAAKYLKLLCFFFALALLLINASGSRATKLATKEKHRVFAFIFLFTYFETIL